jgi:hypothetical protein
MGRSRNVFSRGDRGERGGAEDSERPGREGPLDADREDHIFESSV